MANALAVLAVADELELPIADALGVLGEFKGVARRFEKIGEVDDVLVIDDYAHHPTEVKATLAAARYLKRRIITVFQPHRYTRVAGLLKEFASCFSDTDQLVLTDIYPAGEKPIPGISGKVLAEAVINAGFSNLAYIPDWHDIPSLLAESARPGDVVITMGAGNIRSVGVDLINLLKGGWWQSAKDTDQWPSAAERFHSHQWSEECCLKIDGRGLDGPRRVGDS